MKLDTLPETNSKPPRKLASQKETIVIQPFQPSIFRGKLAVSFRGGFLGRPHFQGNTFG